MIDRLDRSFASQQSFIQDIYHELKEPLAILINDIEMLMSRSCSEEECKKVLCKGLGELAKFSVIIEDLLILAKFDNSRMPLEIKKINLSRLLEEVLHRVNETAMEKDIAVSSFLQETIIVDGDEIQLIRLFFNLLDNAVKYTYRKGKIIIAAHKDGKFARVTISDTGVGMPEEELSYIFDRFYQINKSRSGKHGFGLGLSIAQSIAESHKGKITVESQVGKGSAFNVLLPVSYPG